MSGFAHQSGHEDGPPTLPPFGLADGVANVSGALAVVLTCDTAGGSGRVIDLSLLEPLLGILGPGPSVYDQLGIIAGRHGNRSPNNAPRNAYLTADDRWVAISASATSVAERVMRLVSRPTSPRSPWFASAGERVVRGELIDRAVAEVDPPAEVRRGGRGVPGGRGRPGPDRHRAAAGGPAGPGPRDRHHHPGRGPGPAEDAEPVLPHAADAR